MPAATVIPVLHYQDVQTAAAWLCRMFGFSERQYSAVDPGGHVWTFSQTEANVDPSLWGGELVQAEPQATL
jgi:uncharacterized glyoxalase superfamily protein PhnB